MTLAEQRSTVQKQALSNDDCTSSGSSQHKMKRARGAPAASAAEPAPAEPSTSGQEAEASSRVLYVGHLPHGFYEDQLKGVTAAWLEVLWRQCIALEVFSCTGCFAALRVRSLAERCLSVVASKAFQTQLPDTLVAPCRLFFAVWPREQGAGIAQQEDRRREALCVPGVCIAGGGRHRC